MDSDPGSSMANLRLCKTVQEKTMFTKRRRISELLLNCQKLGKKLGKKLGNNPRSWKFRIGLTTDRSIPSITVILGLFLIFSSCLTITFGSQHVFSNQFAVYIPAGDHKADEIAKKHNCNNLGQIGSLSGYYLFEAHRITKRSVSMDDKHHEIFENEQDVLWFEQQVQKKRVKRDFNYFDVQPIQPAPVFYSAGQSFLPAPALTSQNPFADPLYPEQWYLTGGSKDGFDMNVQAAWKKGFTGKGVTVSILDDGIQTNHPDLLQNYDARASTDINDNDNDPMPQDNGDNKHGTRCAGEVAATAGNSICGVGVAYNASIGGVRMLDGTVNDAVEAKALGLNPDHIDIYSASWGPEDDGKTVDGPGPLARRAFIYGVSNGRRGLGSIFIWASGNGGRHVDSCNCDGYTNSIFTLSISSATQGGFKPWYLEECSSTLATTYSSGTPTLDKSVATVDMDARLRPDHICTVEHTGTSASAPLAAGIAALALEANRNLSWRDLQHLVVISSRPNPLEKEEGWYVNGVQRKFSHKFGYGLMDAGAMVDLAVSWSPVPPQHICKSREIREDREIPGAHLGKVKVFMDVDGCAGSNSEIRFLEHVQCKISLRFFPRGNLRIQLTSPMGTTSVLLFERPRDVSSSNFDDWPFLSVHFWGEQAHGRWTLEIINSGSRRINQSGILKKWQLILYGTDVNPVRVRTRSLHNPPFPPPPLPSNLPPFQQQRRPFEPPVQQHQQQQFRHYQPIATRQHIPSEFLYPGASESVPQTQKQPTIRAQCQNDYWVPDLAICVNACPEGYYSNSTVQRECNACPSRCKACYNSTSCTACEHNLVLLDKTCVPSCPEGYFESDSSCEKCPLASCKSCTDPMGKTCVGCKNQMVLHDGGCLPHCPGGFRPTASRECAPCPSGCQSCDANTCLKCFDGFTFGDDRVCVDENPVCPTGLYLDNETNQCKGCGNAECLQCDGADHCLECVEHLFLQNGNCVTSCADGAYTGFNGKHCFTCPSLCSSCISAEECTECTADGNLQGNKCIPHCLDGFYSDKGICRQCSSGCKTCVAFGNAECITCNTGFEYTRSGGCNPEGQFSVILKSNPQLLSQIGSGDSCAAGFWLNRVTNTCQPCHRSCSNCTGGNPYNCKSCVHPLRFDRGSSRCIECCHKSSDQDCCSCDSKRHVQREETPLTRGYDGECHSVSRRVSENEDLTTKTIETNNPTILGLFWLSVMSLIVIFIVVIHQRRRRRITAATSVEYIGNDYVDFKCRKIPDTRKSKYAALYTPVSLSPCDEDDLRTYLVGGPENSSDVNSDDETSRKVGTPLVLQT